MWASSPHAVAEKHGLDLEELLAMAEYLDVDPTEGLALLDAVGLAAEWPLQVGWSMHVAEGDPGRVYWHDASSGTSTWEHPEDLRLRNLVWHTRQSAEAPSLATVAEDGGSPPGAAASPPALLSSPTSPDLDSFVGFMESQLSHRVTTDDPATSPPAKPKMELPPIPTLDQLRRSRQQKPNTATLPTNSGADQRRSQSRRPGGILCPPPEAASTLDVQSLPSPEALAAIGGVRTGRMRRVTFGAESVREIPAVVSGPWGLLAPRPEPETR